MRIPKKVKIKQCVYLLILALIFTLLIFLAKWQINRAYEKQTLQAQLSQRLQNTPTPLQTQTQIDPLSQRFLPVSCSGTYLNDYNFLLDNQQQNKKIGYILLTPFKLSYSPKIILINRGWLERGVTRNVLPPIPQITGTISLQGYINSPASGILLGKNVENDTWPLVMQTIDLSLIATKLDTKIENYIVQLTTIDYIGIGSSKHWGYAVQWMALAATVVVYMIYLVTKWN